MDNKTFTSDEISLKELLEKARDWYAYLYSKWKFIVLAGIIGASLGIIYSLVREPVYTAKLSFALEDDRTGGGIGGALGLATTLGLDIGGSAGGVFTGANLTELFKSRSMVEKTLLAPVVVDNQVVSLAEMYIQNNKWREQWDKDPKLKKIQFLPNKQRLGFSRVHDSILGVIYEKLSMNGLSVDQKDKKISIITMEVSSKNELFAKYFCEALAKQVGRFYVDTKSKKARINMDILEHQTDSIRRELNGAITGVAIANDNTFNLNPALNVQRAPSARRQVDVQANTAILTELVKQTELAKVTVRKDTPLIQVIDRPILPLAVDRFGKLMGLVLGGFLGGFFSVCYFLLKKHFSSSQILT
ncbi:lipopolysaccharide biosynthesis protein [Flavobacterium sp. LAR06]|uniref:lipopolysaccharide biosynthesis protein n=1 Tax=Flavobacterium sp. LAR06 TaxID=3064897 RepID=UPI0035BF18AE